MTEVLEQTLTAYDGWLNRRLPSIEDHEQAMERLQIEY